MMMIVVVIHFVPPKSIQECVERTNIKDCILTKWLTTLQILNVHCSINESKDNIL